MLSPASDTAFYIGSFGVKFYSITMFTAILVGAWFVCWIAKKYYKEVDSNKIFDMLPMVVLSALLGARLYYVMLDWSFFSNHLSEIFAVYHGGLSIHGAILGGFLGGILYVKKHSLNLWKYADVFSYGLILGQVIGRWGNYFNIEAFGKPCNFNEAICLYVPELKRPFQYLDVSYFHPTFLYESIWNFLVLAVLFFVVRKLAKTIDGVVFFVYLALYSIGRLFIENLRLDSVLNLGNLHIAGLVSLLVLAFSVTMIFLRVKKSKAE